MVKALRVIAIKFIIGNEIKWTIVWNPNPENIAFPTEGIASPKPWHHSWASSVSSFLGKVTIDGWMFFRLMRPKLSYVETEAPGNSVVIQNSSRSDHFFKYEIDVMSYLFETYNEKKENKFSMWLFHQFHLSWTLLYNKIRSRTFWIFSINDWMIWSGFWTFERYHV